MEHRTGPFPAPPEKISRNRNGRAANEEIDRGEKYVRGEESQKREETTIPRC